MILSGWGRYPRVECRVLRARRPEDVLSEIQSRPSLIARGNGRSYGDAALNPEATISALDSDRMLSFDEASGIITCEAGVLLEEIIRLFLPRGWFPTVVPGTKFVSVGGAVAADIHGKNHHRQGSFGEQVESMDLAIGNGTVVTCSPSHRRELFLATCGGMGLTGVILRVSFRLMRVATGWMRQETTRAANVLETMDLFERSADWNYSVAWIDCHAGGGSLGRSLFQRAEHANVEELTTGRRTRPHLPQNRRVHQLKFDLPAVTLNRLTVKLFNELYYWGNRQGAAIVPYEKFFFPLDSLRDWNRLYGKSGFVQYQCVIPKVASRDGIPLLLQRISAAGMGSFLSVLKLLRRQHGLLSFPMEGYTLALDFPANPKVFALLRELDAIVADHGGRLYLAKDACTTPEMITRTLGGLSDFRAIRASIDPDRRFNSLQSLRLQL